MKRNYKIEQTRYLRNMVSREVDYATIITGVVSAENADEALKIFAQGDQA